MIARAACGFHVRGCHNLYSSFRPQPLRLAEPYHMVSCFHFNRLCVIGWTIPRGSTRTKHCPEAWNMRQYCFIFLHNTDANMLCRLFDDHKYMDIYLPIHQEYCYLGKQKICLCFSASTCEHLWPSPSHLVNFSNWPINDIFTGFVRTFCSVLFLKFIKFQSRFFENLTKSN